MEKRHSSICITALFCIGWVFLALTSNAAVSSEDFKEYKKQAERGDVDAETAIGTMYHLGQGVPQNYEEALKWYRQAADHGSAIAQHNLGVMYLKGQGVPENWSVAAQWITKAAKQGYAQAEMNLGLLYSQGQGVPRNSAQAVYWSRKAAEQGDPDAQHNLGDIYANGDLAPVDYVEAYKWFSLAAAQGNEDAIPRREALARKMSAQQLSEAQQQAAGFVVKRDPANANLPNASGTGFFVTKDGYFITAYHVVDEAKRIVIKTKVLALAASIVKVDSVNDLALLKVTGAYPPTTQTNWNRYAISPARISPVASRFHPLPIVDVTEVTLGDSISTIGFPNLQLQGASAKFTRGEINSLTGLKDDPRYFQISAQIQPGNSGGPLLDKSGNVVGMVQLALNDLTQLLRTGSVPQNVNYALKSSHILTFLKSLSAVTLTEPKTQTEENQSDSWVSEISDSVAVVLSY
ncbi:MAG TPA: tetratricopeptide repeat-containing serine protease family protein [Verrucomicrobiae bacterium]